MLKSFFVVAVLLVNIIMGLPVQNVRAATGGVVIYQVFSGVKDFKEEFIALYNNSNAEVDISDWCLTNKSAEVFACFAADADTEIVIGAREFFTIGSESLDTVHLDVHLNISDAITGTSDTITLTEPLGETKVTVDSVSWTESLDFKTGNAFERKHQAGVMQDTNLPDDFVKVTNGVPVQNIDLCLNLSGTQNFQPAGTIIDSAGNCIEPPVDVCTNLPDVQLTVPAGYISTGNECSLDVLPLQITELLPNATGADTGREYIELYNPTDRIADLSLYTLYVGLNNEKSYQFPAGSFIGAGEYKTFYDNHIGFTLTNTTGRVALMGIDDTPISQTEPYADAADDYAWANISGAWQYTNQPTPGAVNLLSLEEHEEPGMGNAPAPCPEGKYRNPLTNRCRNIETDASVIAACDADEYRNPETNRCRKITTASSLTPCKDGQYRSEETNRCRSIETASAQLVPCKEGQERSPETNRCRKAESSTVPKAGYAVQSVQDGAASFIGWWALGGVGVLALGYAGWEWRYEIVAAYRRALSMFNRR